MQKIAILGSGISGLACAYYLHKDHDVHVIESADRIGGHTATVDVELNGRNFAIDTGFIVFNDWTYPNFISLLEELQVDSQPTEMSFSVSANRGAFEYAGSNLNTLFARRSSLLSLAFWNMLRDIIRFNKDSIRDLDSGFISPDMTLGEYLACNGYGKYFAEHYLIPMGSAIWSADTESMFEFPLEFFVRFFRNHGLLSISNRPQWRVIKGGSRTYLEPLCAGFSRNIRTSCNVVSVSRSASGAELTFSDGGKEFFDRVVFACHSDQALAMLSDASPTERALLAAIPYQNNDVVLHTDVSLLPKRRLAWSSWNYLRQADRQRAILTYNMNILQGIEADTTFCVTLNASDQIAPSKILGRFNYSHPVFTLEGMKAQARWHEINGGSTWFCGAYWRHGFHEDGVFSARRVADAIASECEVVTALGSAA